MKTPIYILGPCAAESMEQLRELAASLLQNTPCFILRAGVWKPRTSPDSFQGIGDEGLIWLKQIQQEFHLEVATEVTTPEQAEKAIEAGIDHLWIGARTAANPIQVQALADAIRMNIQQGMHTLKGVWVKNPVNEDADLWIGNILRMKGTGIPVGAIHRGCNHHPCWAMAHRLRQAMPDIPLLLDPSHMTGDATKVVEMFPVVNELALDGMMVEVHPHPENAMSDSRQQITPEEYNDNHNENENENDNDNHNGNHNGNLDIELNWLRKEIDEVDDSLWEVILKRMEVSEKIGIYKKGKGMEVVQPTRYREIVEKRKTWAAVHHLQAETVEQIMEAIHRESVKRQQ